MSGVGLEQNKSTYLVDGYKVFLNAQPCDDPKRSYMVWTFGSCYKTDTNPLNATLQNNGDFKTRWGDGKEVIISLKTGDQLYTLLCDYVRADKGIGTPPSGGKLPF